MSDEIRKWLTDILDAVDHIDVHLGVERELEIIGEATNRIMKINDTIAISNARRIVDLRNRVIHAYDAVDELIVWSVVVKNLPVLKQEVEAVLQGN